ncbi:MAG TPA: M24 family metallopeptidase, partial [Cellvibrio sp.]
MDKIFLKSADDLMLMRESGRLLASVFVFLDTRIKAGISTMEINDWVEHFIINTLNARPASKGQYDFPYALNTSINDVVCHGMPSATQFLKAGDIINVDITLEKNGFIADSSKMYMIGEVSPLAKKLVAQTYEAMWQGIRAVKPGATLGDIG